MIVLKKIKFLSSKRALLENEIVLKKFYNFVVENYDNEDLEEYLRFLENVYDTDLLDVIIGKKNPEDFKDKYSVKFLKDIKSFVRKLNDWRKISL